MIEVVFIVFICKVHNKVWSELHSKHNLSLTPWLSVFPAQRASSQPPPRTSPSHFPIEFRRLSAVCAGLCMWGRTDLRFSFSDCHRYPDRPCRDLASSRCIQLSELDLWRKWSSRGCTWLWLWRVAWHSRIVFHQFLAEGASQWARRSLGCLFRHCRGSLGVGSTSLNWWLNVEGLCSDIPDSSSDPFSSSSSSESLLELDLEPSLWSDTGILFGSFRWTCCWKRYKSVTMCDWHDAEFRNIYNDAIIYEKRNNTMFLSPFLH